MVFKLLLLKNSAKLIENMDEKHSLVIGRMRYNLLSTHSVKSHEWFAIQLFHFGSTLFTIYIRHSKFLLKKCVVEHQNGNNSRLKCMHQMP